MKYRKNITIFQKEKGNNFRMKSLQKEQNSTNLLPTLNPNLLE
jgi:hypothetical protein